MTRLTKEHRRAQIIDAACRASYHGRLYRWTLADIAASIGISTAAVRRYFTSAIALRDAVIGEADSHDLISQAITAHDPAVMVLTLRRRRDAMRWLVRESTNAE